MTKLLLIEIAVADVVPYPRNARTHSNAQIVQLENPSADRFVAHIDLTFGKHFLNVTIAQREAKVEPNGSLDY
jgi:hypothetical protein